MPESQTVSKAQILALAKQGDPNAITQLINSSLQAKGIKTTVFWQNGSLEILLEASFTPDPIGMMAFIRRGFEALNAESINVINVNARQTGIAELAWRQELRLDDDDQGSLVIGGASGTSGAKSGDASLLAQTTEVSQSVQLTRFLRVQLGSHGTALLPLVQIKEILKILPNEILPVPDMPACVLGIYNCRGEMLWLVDLTVQLGLQSSLPSHSLLMPETAYVSRNGSGAPSLTAIVIESEEKSGAIVISKLFDIELFNLHELEPPLPQLFPSNLLPFIQGYFPDAEVPVLDVNALLQDPQFQIHAID
jgi:positive phototaxis protein PixI